MGRKNYGKQHESLPGQTGLNFETPFKARMNELRARLRSVDVSVLSISPLRWDQVMEAVMAIWAHTGNAGDCRAETARVTLTSGLTRDQYYRALAAAKQIGIVSAMPTYTPDTRSSDRLRIDERRLDELVALSRANATAARGCEQVRRAANRCDELRTGATTLKEPARAGIELPKNLSTSSSTRVRVKRKLAKTVEVVEEAVKKLGVDCRQIREAVQHAVRVGKASRQELLERVAWFGVRLDQYKAEHRGGALCRGVENAVRGMPVHQGWPYSENFLEQEAHRHRERERLKLLAQQNQARHRAQQEQFEQARHREREHGPLLNGMSDEELRALELECFRDEHAAAFVRGRSGYREILLKALANRAEKGSCT